MDWSFLLDVAYAVVVLVAGWFAGGWAAGALGMALARTGLDPVIRNLLRAAVRPVVLVVAAVAALELVGAYTGGLLAVLGAAAVAVGLGLKGSLSNVASGALLLSLRPFNIGDLVELAGITGVVRELGLFTVSLETADGHVVTLVNDRVLAGPVRNLSRKGLRRVDVALTVRRDQDLDALRDRLLGMVAEDACFLAAPPPALVFGDPRGARVPVTVQAWTATADHAAAGSELRRRIAGVAEP